MHFLFMFLGVVIGIALYHISAHKPRIKKSWYLIVTHCWQGSKSEGWHADVVFSNGRMDLHMTQCSLKAKYTTNPHVMVETHAIDISKQISNDMLLKMLDKRMSDIESIPMDERDKLIKGVLDQCQSLQKKE